MPQQHTPAAGSSQTPEQQMREFWEHEFNKAGSSAAEWDGTPRVAEFITQTRKVFGFSFLGWRFEAYREPAVQPCPQCGGFGMWRPPYSRERVPCDLCTSTPISQASATTSDSSAPFDSKA